MRKIVLILLSFTVLYSCSNPIEQKKKINSEIEINQFSDTLIGQKTITNEIAGAAHRKRATGYYVINEKDTSGFMPIFTESIKNGQISINQNLSYSNKTKTYFQRLSELKTILQKAEKDFNFDSLSTMSIGRLILSGDLAITLTEEYKNKFGENENIKLEYKEISDFLLESTLTKDLNQLLKPYSKSVEKVNVEKVFFAKRSELLKYSNVTKDTTDIPNQILDFMAWVTFKNK